jgi:tetratricopeptide (TPR) repeat protein
MRRKATSPIRRDKQSDTELTRLRRELSVANARNKRLADQLANIESQALARSALGLTLDLRNGTGSLVKGGVVLRLTPQWIEYFALLYLHSRNTDSRHRFVSASELNTVGQWREKKEGTVGREVARFLKNKLEKSGFQDVIGYEPNHRTSSWRLASETTLVGGQTAAELAEELDARGWRQTSLQSAATLPEFVKWVDGATNVLMLLQQGEVLRAKDGAELLLKETEDPILIRVSRLLVIRTIQRAGSSADKSDIDLGDYQLVHSWGVGAVARAFHTRAVALMTYWGQPDDYEKELQHLRALLADAEAIGDIGAIGSLYGTLAVLNRRSGSYDVAEEALRRAIPMLIANGDIMNLQGALFNMGHVIERLFRAERKYSYANALEVLQLDMDLRDKFNLGRDSAQCEIQKQVKDRANGSGLVFVDGEGAVLAVVADRHPASHPHTLLFGCGDLVADPLPRDFALELRKRQKHIEGQAPHRRRGVELLGDRDKGDAGRIEDFDDFREIRQRPGKTIHLVDHDHVNQMGLDIGQQPLKGRPVRRSAGIAAVVIERGQGDPSFVPLTLYIGITGFALRMQGIEVLFQSFFGRFAGVDRAAKSPCG